MVSKLISCVLAENVHLVQEHKGELHNLNNDIQLE